MAPWLCLPILLTATAQADWGAVAPDSADRPDLSWLTRFANKADVVATGDINTAIDQCDQKVGHNNYCVIELRTPEAIRPFVIDRSNIKIVASAASKALLAVPGKATISIASNTQKILIENLQLAGVRSGFKPIYGIVIAGSYIQDIVVRNSRLFNFDSDSSAHGIVVLGSGANETASIKRITIDQNHLHDMRTGSSESIAVNGNVSNWVISNNLIERVNNIAIDAIGGEGTVAATTVEGRVLPHALDAARTGWIENNVVDTMTTLSNPAYGNVRSWAGAIYVDGGRSISITGNTVRSAPWAYDIGAENCVIAEHIVLRNNSAADSYYGDLRLGGYATTGYLSANNSINCDPGTSEDINEGHGYVRHLTIADNRFETDNPTQARIMVEYRTTASIIAEPGLEPSPGAGDGSAIGDNNAYRLSQ